MLLTHALALSANQFLCKKKSRRVRTYVHSVRIELAKLILVGRHEENLPSQQRELLLHRERGLNRNTKCIWYVEVWELKLYFYPSAGGLQKKTKTKTKTSHRKRRLYRLVPGTNQKKLYSGVLRSIIYTSICVPSSVQQSATLSKHVFYTSNSFVFFFVY